jgi:hypothetical protein
VGAFSGALAGFTVSVGSAGAQIAGAGFTVGVALIAGEGSAGSGVSSKRTPHFGPSFTP